MRGQYVANRFADELQKHGETMQLQRMDGQTITVKAQRFGSAAETVINSQTRTTFSVKISAREIAASGWSAPAKKWTLTAAGRAYKVEEVDPRSHDGITLAYFLKVTG